MKTEINIKREIALSILNIGEILTKTIDYYSLKDRKNDLNELIEICNQQQNFKEKKTPQIKYAESVLNNNYLKNAICSKYENDPGLNSLAKQKFQSIVSFKSYDKKSNYSLNHLIHDVDKKIKILNGIFSANDYNNLSDESNSEVEIKDLSKRKDSDTFSYLYERMDLFEEMKELNDIMKDLNLIVYKNDPNVLNYGSFI